MYAKRLAQKIVSQKRDSEYMTDKIELMIIGAQKAGTTSLNRYLLQHPAISTHNTIEFGMFADEAAFNRGFDYYYQNSVDTIVKNDKSKTHFVAKRVGLMNNKLLMQKLLEHNAAVKVVVVLRHPIARAFSAFQYCRNKGMEPYDNFEDAVYKNDPIRFKGNARIQKNCEYILRSNYLQHLKNVYEIFPAHQVKILLLEQMTGDLNHYLNEMVTWVGLTNYDFDISIRYNEMEATHSVSVAKMLSPGKADFIKNILPLAWRTKIKNVLRGANTKAGQNNIKTELKESTRQYLLQVFKKDICELQTFTKLPLQQYWPDLFE